MEIDISSIDRSIVFRSLIILLGLDLSINVNSLSSLHRCQELNRRQTVRLAHDARQVDRPISMNFELDEWSQYENPEEGNAREGDIRDNPFFRKTTTTDEQLLWPNGVVRYFVDQTIVDEPTKLAILQDAMKNIMEISCVKFERIYPDSNGEMPFDTWVNITGYEEGCFSDVGRSAFGSSIINLDVRKCFRTRGHVLHELLHTLGIFHEHMRPDRDDHIEIIWGNIKEDNAFNFCNMDDHAVTNYGLPYDYDSIMHYSMTAFSKNKSVPTIVPRKKGVTIGQRDHLSYNDVKKVLLTYKCNAADRNYASEEIDRDYREDVEFLNSDGMIRSDDRFKDSLDNFDERVPHRKSFYQFTYSQYLPKPPISDSHHDYYCHYYYS